MTTARNVDTTSRPETQRQGLTKREREVLLWTAQGKTSPEAATILGVSANTVNFHLKNTCRKLEANNKTKAAAIAVERGLIAMNARTSATSGVPCHDIESAVPQRRARSNGRKRPKPARIDTLTLLEREIASLLNAMRMMEGDWHIPQRTLHIVLSRIQEIRRHRKPVM